MNSTKRKFNALLQGLSSPRPSTEGESPAAMFGNRVPSGKISDHEAMLQKRRRLGFPDETAPRMDTSVSSGLTSLASSIRRTVSDATTPKVRRDGPARYSPGDREELLRRLATFQEITDWTPKPDRINEVEWAKRGWVCQGKERVRCLLCHKELVVKLRKEAAEGGDELTSAEVEAALVDKYAELIVSAHQSDCLWKRRGCDDSLIRLSFVSTKGAIEALKGRYEELCSRAAFLPYEFNIHLPEGMNLDEVISQLPSDFFTGRNPTPEPVRPALALALLGWQGLTNTRIGAVPNTASCHTCQRRLGLWMFKSKEVDANGNVVVPAPMDYLDPEREHRFFCPWKNPAAQSRGHSITKDDAPDMPAWKILLQAIKNESDLRSVYEGRLKPSSKPAAAATPSTPLKTTARQAPHHTPNASVDSLAINDEDDEATRDAKDKERWARLRKVKSLFDTKKLRKSMSNRPETPHSIKSARSIKGD
ncbi:C3HC zinc finger-like domain-containing protein [Trichoderma novae-zelandiae]